MDTYNYVAKTLIGETKKGELEAVDEKAVAAVLQEKNLIPINIKIKSERNLASLSKKRGVSAQDKMIFTRMLSTMVSTGLPLGESLDNLQAQATNPNFREIICAIIRDISGGSQLSAALSRFPQVFPNIYVNMVKAGEAAGNMDKTLMRLAETMEKEEDFRGKVKGAMMYPMIVVGAMGLIGTLMMTMVIPKIGAVYKEMGADLPLPTKVLISISDFFSGYWWTLPIFIGSFIFAWRYLKKTSAGDYWLNNLMFKMPIFGSLSEEVLLSNFCRTLGALTGSGISILEALNITSQILGHNVYQTALNEITKSVEKGFPLSSALRKYPIFPRILAQMVSIGEETGTLDESLNRLALYFEGNAERKVKGLTTALEPLMIMVMGVGVGGLAIAVLMPMFNLVNVIK